MKSTYDDGYRRVIRQLQRVRLAHGLTQAQVAHRIGMTRTTMSRIETCERRLDLQETHMLAGVLGMKLSDLEPLLEVKAVDDASHGPQRGANS